MSMKAGHHQHDTAAIFPGILLCITGIVLVTPCLAAYTPPPAIAMQNVNSTPIPMVADFTADVTRGSSPLTVQFTDTSLPNPTIWAWDFEGDGRIDSRIRNPWFTYQEPGTYSVTLMVSGRAGKDQETKKGFIIVIREELPPIADFTSDSTSGTAPMTVRFSDRSRNSPSSWEWDLDGDGTIDSHLQHPTATYKVPGIYSVRLAVANTAGSDAATRTGYLTVYGVTEDTTRSRGEPLQPTAPETTRLPSLPLTNIPAQEDSSGFLVPALLFILAALIAAGYLILRSRSPGHQDMDLHFDVSGEVDFGGELPSLIDPAETLEAREHRKEER